MFFESSINVWRTPPVMSEYHIMDPNKYTNIFGCHVIYRTNIQIYSDATYLLNKYPNIFVLGKWHKYKYDEYSRAISF